MFVWVFSVRCYVVCNTRLEAWSWCLWGPQRAAGPQLPALSSAGPSWPRTGASSLALPWEAAMMQLENGAHELDAVFSPAPASQF